MECVCGYAGVGFVRVGLSPATGSTCLRLNLNLNWTGASLPPPPPPFGGVRLVVGVRLRRSLPRVSFSAEQLSCHLSVGAQTDMCVVRTLQIPPDKLSSHPDKRVRKPLFPLKLFLEGGRFH